VPQLRCERRETFTPRSLVVNDLRKALAVVLSLVAAIAMAGASSELERAGAEASRPAGNGAMAASGAAAQGLLGAWGGEHIRLELTAEGGVAEFDCAQGEITGAIVPDRRGRFDVPGRYAEEHGGPVREGEAPVSFAVRYAGQVKGREMTLTVTRSETKEHIGTFALARGQEPSLVKCR